MKTLYRVALSMLPQMGIKHAQVIYDRLEGDLSRLFRPGIEKEIPELSSNIIAALHSGQALRRAEEELTFVEKHRLKLYHYEDAAYPSRLKACPDAPLLFYMKGDVSLEAAKILSVVGTRKMSDYGRCQTEDLLEALAAMLPDLLIVSGLAYGVDVCAHRAAMKNGLPTLGVVAHGLNKIYPSQHRGVAKEMLRTGGGILSEFPSGTEAFRSHFVQRNRIVAGLCDACLVIESPEKGGSLITARMARDYNREVFALPGRPVDANSRGCNLLIKQQIASLVESTEDIIKEMNWDLPHAKSGQPAGPAAMQPTFFDSLSPEEEALLALMQADKKYGAQDLLELSLAQHQESCARHIGEVLSVLLLLEMNQAVISLPGGLYQRRPGR